LIVGSAALFIDRSKTPLNQKSKSVASALCNLLDLVSDLTITTRQSLSDDELNLISRNCVTALNQTSFLQKASKQFKNAVGDDLKLSATLAVDGRFGLSRWHSLQSAEKAIKTFIKDRGARPSRIHDLQKLHGEAIRVGLSPISSTDLADAQCSAEVRYETKLPNQANVLAANEAARRICNSIATQLPLEGKSP
jgi:HEPN domain-containing protein